MRAQIFLVVSLLHFGAIVLLLWLLLSPIASHIRQTLFEQVLYATVQARSDAILKFDTAAQPKKNAPSGSPLSPAHSAQANSESAPQAQPGYLAVRLWRGPTPVLPELTEETTKPLASPAKKTIARSIKAVPADDDTLLELPKNSGVPEKDSLRTAPPQQTTGQEQKLTQKLTPNLIPNSASKPAALVAPTQIQDPDMAAPADQVAALSPALLPLPKLSDTRDYLPLPGSIPAGYQAESQSESQPESQPQVPATLANRPAQPEAAEPEHSEPANAAPQPTQPSSGSILESVASSSPYSAATMPPLQNAQLPPPGVQQASIPLQNGHELNWQFEWQGKSQRKLRYLPSLRFPSQMLQGLEDQTVEIIFQVDANGKVVSASFAGDQLKAYNWQINSALLEKVGQFRFEAEDRADSVVLSQWLHKGRVKFHFRQTQAASAKASSGGNAGIN